MNKRFKVYVHKPEYVNADGSKSVFPPVAVIVEPIDVEGSAGMRIDIEEMAKRHALHNGKGLPQLVTVELQPVVVEG